MEIGADGGGPSMTAGVVRIGISGGNDPHYLVPLDQPGAIPFDPENCPDLWRRSGRNLGNLIWAYAARQIFGGGAQFVELGNDAIAKRGMDVICLAMANLFTASDRNEGLAKSLYGRLENTDIPIFVLTVGVQHGGTDSFPSLGPWCLRLLRLLGEKAAVIGVRGAFTKAVFLHYGVPPEKVLVTGCPSILLNPDVRLGRLLEERFPFRGGSVVTSLPAYKAQHRLCRKLLEIGARDGCATNLQSTLDLLAARRGELSPEALADLFEGIFERRGSAPEVQQFFREHISYFNDLPNWVHYLSRFGHGISARIHGAVAMLTAGVPTVVVGIDSRVMELCETFRIPNISKSEFFERSVDEIFAQIRFDGETFDLNRQLLATRHLYALAQYGLPPSDQLRRLADGD